jgi:hypothetical protein
LELSDDEGQQDALHGRPTWRTFVEKLRPSVFGSGVFSLRPSPVRLMRPLFEPIGWSIG